MLKIKNLLFWAVFPLLIPQALYVRWKAPRFAPADGPREGIVGEGEQVRLLAIGDSIIAGVGASGLSKALVGRTAQALAESLQCRVAWQALGVSGHDCRETLERQVPRLPREPFEYMVVSVGVNDVTGLASLKAWRQNLARLIRELQTHSPNSLIALAGLPPLHCFPLLPQPLRATFGLRARLFDEIAKTVVESFPNARHVSLDFEPGPEQFAADGYHPSEQSYVEFGRQMADALMELLAMQQAFTNRTAAQ